MTEQLTSERSHRIASYSWFFGSRYPLDSLGSWRPLQLEFRTIGVFRSWLVNTEESLRGSLIRFLPLEDLSRVELEDFRRLLPLQSLRR
mmetsp:Transcript_35598/g.56950  ORF Transcript_35598/g.56950 Transcript_35598/m.56950 type:complete len:89 (-) Transcript_35598:58-324(-)